MFSLKILDDEFYFAKCLFYYFKVLGMGTMKLESSSKKLNCNNQLHFLYSNTGAIYNFAVLNLLIFFNYFSIKFTCNYRIKSIFEKIFDSSQYSLTLLTATIAQLMFVVKQKEVITICNKINQVRESMTILDPQIFCKKVITRSIAKTLMIIGIVWCPVFITVSWNGTWYLLCTSPIFMSNFLASNLILQYSTILKYFEKQFSFINEKLVETSAQPLVLLSKECQSNQCIQIKDKKGDTLLLLRYFYIALYEISQDVAKFYSLPMLLNILNIFMACILSAYYVVEPFLFQQKLPILVIFHCAAYGILNVTLMLILTHSVTATVNESRKTGQIINNFYATSEDLKMIIKLNQFSNYLVHAKVEFTVYKLFTLDQSLLTSVVGTIATYLVIILQFQQSN